MNTSYNVAPNSGDSFSGLEPIGSILLWVTPNPPTHYLVCNGNAINRITYGSLFKVIGTVFGAGDGSTTFNLPNAGGRSIRGTAGGFPLGSSAGADSIQLDISNLPRHGHQINDPGHQHPAVFQGTGFAASDGGNGNRANFPGTTSVAVTGITVFPSLDDLGGNPIPGSAPFNITNPFLVLNYIIRAT